MQHIVTSIVSSTIVGQTIILNETLDKEAKIAYKNRLCGKHFFVNESGYPLLVRTPVKSSITSDLTMSKIPKIDSFILKESFPNVENCFRRGQQLFDSRNYDH